MTKLLYRSEFGRNVVTMMTGSVLGQLLPILASPFLTRLYTPEDFGVFALFTSVISIVSVVVTGRYELAIVLPKEDDDAAALVLLTTIVVLCLSLVFQIISFVFGASLLSVFDSEALGVFIYLVPLSAFLFGIVQTLSYWGNRKKYFKKIAINRVVQSFVTAGVSLGVGFFIKLSSGLVLGVIAGQLAATIHLVKYIWSVDSDLLSRTSFLRAREMGIRYVSFVKYGVVALFTSSLAQQSLFFLVAHYLNATVLGLVSLVQRIVAIPSSIVGNSLGEVFYQEISQVPKSLSGAIVTRFAIKLMLISSVMHIAMYVGISLLFIPVFGGQWSGALFYLKYFILVSAFSFIFSPLSVLFNYYEIQKMNFVWQSAWLVSNLGLFFFYAKLGWTIETLFAVYTFKQCVLYVLGILGFLLIARRKHE